MPLVSSRPWQGNAGHGSGGFCLAFDDVVDDGHQDVEHNDEGEGCPATQGEADDAEEDESVAQLVAFQSEVLKLEGEHGNFCDEEPRGEQNASQQGPTAPRRGHQPVVCANGQCSPKEGVGRRGQTDEGGALALV